MEGIAMNAYNKLKGLSRTRGYKRLHRHHRLRTSTSDVCGTTTDPNLRRRHRRQKHRIWRRIKISPKLQMFSPNNFFAKLRDAYVNFMLKLAASPALSGAGAGGGYGAVDYGVGGFRMRPVRKDYDEKVIIEIYKSLVRARGQVADDNSHPVSATQV